MRRSALSLLLLFTVLFTEAKTVSIDNARSVATQFMMSGNRASSRDGVPSIVMTDVMTITRNGEAVLYVFNGNGGGYAIVSADDETQRQVLGWSRSGSFDPLNIPDPMKVILEGFADGIQTMRNSTYDNWNTVSVNTSVKAGSLPDKVDPLLDDIEWGQGAPFYNMCPYVGGYYCVTGCVATATAQIMRYHRWPSQGRGSHSYEWNGQVLSADFSKSTYQWDLMLPNYNGDYTQEQGNAVALLMHDVGIAVNMDYGISESGSNIWGYELVDYFDYDKNIKSVDKDYCSVEDWEAILKSELAAGRPVLCAGGSQAGAHEFVCDGYDADGFFHYNYGWNGYNNGWFASTATGFDLGASYLYGIQKNNGGTGALTLISRDDFNWSEGNTFSCALEFRCCGLHNQADYSIELGIALLNTANGQVQYHTIQEVSTEYYYYQLIFGINVPDGSYKVYPVGRLNGGEWQTFTHNTLRQIEVDLTVTNGVKNWENNHLLDLMDEGKVELDGFYYILNEASLEATVTSRNERGNSYSGDVIIPDSIIYIGNTYKVTSVGNNAFDKCSDLNTVVVGKNVRTLGQGAFNWASLNSITFAEGSNLTTVGGWAFNGCNKLKECILPEGTEILMTAAFQTCSAMEKIVIPSSVRAIYDCCFNTCTSLKDIFVSWTSLSYLNMMDDFTADYLGDLSKITLHVPNGCGGIYRNSSIWGNFIIVEEEAQQTVERRIYVIGCDGEWNPAVASAYLSYRSDSCYAGTVTVNNADGRGYGYFCIGTVLDADWNVFNHNRLGAPSPDYYLESGSSARFYRGSNASYMVSAGTHYIVVNLGTGYISLDDPAGVKSTRILDSPIMYDLSGNRVVTPERGEIIIRNGQKFIAE